MHKPIKYITENERDYLWGLVVCSVGYQSIKPGENYPPSYHNQEHMFNPQKGRLLQEYQLLYITKGRGLLKNDQGQEFQIEEGNMFLLFPGKWHTYYPLKEIGWDEYWIGFRGVNIDARVQAGFFSPDQPVYKIGKSNTIVDLYKQALDVATRQDAFFQQLLAGIVNHLLGLLFMINQNYSMSGEKETPEVIRSARTYMQDHIEEDLNMPDVAKRLNLSYTTFRRVFKKYVGLSPAKYYISLKLHRAKELLRSTELPIKEISYQLKFKNPEYFSALFKKMVNVNPSEFRDTM